MTQIQNRGVDSTTWQNVTPATTTYNYWLATIPAAKNPNGASCNPITAAGTPSYPKQTDCVSDTWVPGYNGVTVTQDEDWFDYYHQEFQGL